MPAKPLNPIGSDWDPCYIVYLNVDETKDLVGKLGIVVLDLHRYQYESRLITVGQVFVLESSLKEWPYSFVEIIY